MERRRNERTEVGGFALLLLIGVSLTFTVIVVPSLVSIGRASRETGITEDGSAGELPGRAR